MVYVILFRFQSKKSSTDTIAVNLDNTPFREKDDSYYSVRQATGLCSENLGQLDADIIFIKNIDNVVTDRIKADTITYKRALAGIDNMQYQKENFWLPRSTQRIGSKALLSEIDAFFRNELCVIPPAAFDSWIDRREATIFCG